jgi:peptidoglycan/xylan/chitin deacetylase (PgdA/CDA1 family)
MVMDIISKKKIGASLCSLVPLDIWHRLAEIDLVIPHWHLASDQDLAHVTGMYRYRRCREFTEDVEFFLRRYMPASLGEVISYLDGVGVIPKRCVLFTFDDGLREIYDIVAPILYAKGIPGTFFLITSAIDNRELCYPQKKSLLINALACLKEPSAEREVALRLTEAGIKGPDIITRIRSIYYRKKYLLDELGSIIGCDFAAYVNSVQPYLTSDQIRGLLRMGFSIGAHSIDHPKYAELSLKEQLYQTIESTKFISAQYNYDCNTFAFPYADSEISPDFYHKVFSENILKASFGIGSIVRGSFNRHLPRFSMEGTNLPAAKILAYQFGRALVRRPLGIRIKN